MANSYVHLDGGAEVDPFWGTTVPPQAKGRTIDDVVGEMKKSFYKNATRLDFTSTDKGHFTLGKIGTTQENTEYRVWKSFEHVHNTDLVEELFRTYDESEALSKFNEITGGSFQTQTKTEGTGLQTQTFSQADIGQSELEQAMQQRDAVQEMFDYKAKSDFAKNAQKMDFVPDNQGRVIVLGMIGKSELDRDSKYRIWKTYDHWRNENVEYLTGNLDRKAAISAFSDLTKNI